MVTFAANLTEGAIANVNNVNYEILEAIDAPNAEYSYQVVESAVGGIAPWDATKTYALGEVVTSGSQTFISISDNNLNQNPNIDNEQWWTRGTGEYSDEYSIAQDQFSGYQGSWADYVNNVQLAGNELVKMFDAGTFDFNGDGNPLTVAAGDVLQYQYDTWVNISTVPTVEDAEVVLIDSEGVNNTFYAFSSGWIVLKLG